MSIVTYSEDMQTVYVRINWQNQPSTSTALGATNLNKIDLALSIIDGRVVALNTTKLDKATANTMVQDIDLDANGVFTIKKLDGTTKKYDTKLEKLAVNFEYDVDSQRLVITLDDGTKQYVDMSALITEFEFVDTSTIAFTKNAGKMSANIKNGSVTEDKLQPNFLADIKVQSQNASNSAAASAQSRDLSKRYAVGGIVPGDATDNSKYYMEQARIARDEAEDISNVGVATDTKLGLVKGNGNVEVRSDGAMWANPYEDKASNQTGSFITCPTSDDALVHIKKIEGETIQVVSGNSPSPEYPSPLEYAKQFDVYTSNINIIPFPYKDISKVLAGITYTVNSDGSIIVSGTSTGYSSFSILGNATSDYTKLKLVLKSGVTYFNSLGTSMRFRKTNGEYVGINNNSSLTPTEDLLIGAIYFETATASGTVVNKTYYPMLKVGTVATAYTQNKSDKKTISFPFMSVPLAKNRKEYVNNVFNNVVAVKEFVFNGTETFIAVDTIVENKKRFSLPITDVIVPTDDVLGRISCSHFKNVLASDTWNNKQGISINYTTRGVQVYNEEFATWAGVQFKTWVKEQYDKGTPLTIQYQLANTIVEEFDPIYLKSFKGTTHLFTTSDPQVTMTVDFKSELWSRDYLQDKLINSKFDSNSEIEFTEATSDVDIATKDTLPTIFGKILKSIKTLRSGLALKFDKSNIVQTDTAGGTDKVASAEVTKALGLEVDAINNNLIKHKYVSGMAVSSVANIHVSVYDITNDVDLANKNVLGILPSVIGGWTNGDYMFSLYYNIETKKVMLVTNITQTYTVSFIVLYI